MSNNLILHYDDNSNIDDLACDDYLISYFKPANNEELRNELRSQLYNSGLVKPSHIYENSIYYKQEYVDFENGYLDAIEMLDILKTNGIVLKYDYIQNRGIDNNHYFVAFRNNVLEKLNRKVSSKKLLEEVANHILFCKTEVEQILNGEVYSYTIVNEEGDELASCGGFIGINNSAIIQYVAEYGISKCDVSKAFDKLFGINS